MDRLSEPEVWRDLYVMLGTTAGALIGLLFIVTSLHLGDIVNNQAYRLRARNNSLYLLALVIEAALILAPQPMKALGIELLLISLFLLQLHLRIIYKFYLRNRALGERGGFQIGNATRFVTSRILGVAGGIALIMGFSWGLYLETACYLLFLTSIVMNAWSIMLGVGEEKGATRTG